ncbi:hypothetical protein ABZT49_03315 [Methylobacterium sp. EM32]|uniref:hypothetical protein n=1 Tax=Methylobacterium sp. EM32 TaxID=3163481 RepID=UPI0033ADABDF
MTAKASRRDIICFASYLLATSKLHSQTADTVVKISDCYVSQSGNVNSGFFVIGMLQTREFARHARNLQELRLHRHYTRELVANSTDKYKLPYVEGLIDYITNQQEMRFACCIVTIKSWPDEPDARDAITLQCHNRLISQFNSKRDEIVSLHFKKFTTIRNSIVMEALGNNEIRVRRTDYHYPGGSEMLNYSDLLSNIVGSSYRKIKSGSRASALKYLKEKLNVENFEDKALVTHPVFRVRFLNL